MTKNGPSSNKAKIARRVIEVLEFFDDDHTEATVMDIVRRYDRPQSSTSELLSSLVELGLLSKDPYSRTYRLTARAAMLGTAGQPEMVRDGRLVRLLDRLVAQTGLSVALYAMVGLDVQVFNWRPGKRSLAGEGGGIIGGAKEPLSQNAAGWLLASTIEDGRREGTIRRLNAEADDTCKFNATEMLDRIGQCRENLYVCGPAGFGTQADVAAALVPCQPDDHALAIGIVYTPDGKASQESLLECIGDAMRQCLPAPESAEVQKFPTAA